MIFFFNVKGGETAEEHCNFHGSIRGEGTSGIKSVQKTFFFLLCPNIAGTSCCQMPLKLFVFLSYSEDPYQLSVTYSSPFCFFQLHQVLSVWIIPWFWLLANASCTQFKFSQIEWSSGSHSCPNVATEFMAHVFWVLYIILSIYQHCGHRPTPHESVESLWHWRVLNTMF